MGLYLRNSRYYYKKQIEGKTYYRALKLKKGQERLLSERIKQIETEIIAVHYGIRTHLNKNITFLEYVEKYLQQVQYKKTWERDKQNLCVIYKSIGNIPLRQIGKPHIQKLERYLFTRHVKPSTVNRYFELLRHFFNLAIEDGYIQENPCKYYIPYVEGGSRQVLSLDELQRILKAAHTIQQSPRSPLQSMIYDIILLALNTGMRLGEIIFLKKSYIHQVNTSLVILYPVSETKYKRRLPGQKRKYKSIALNNTASQVIKKYTSHKEYIFQLPWRNTNVMRKTIARIRKMAKVPGFTFHQLRHTVSSYIANQESIIVAKAVLGHEDIKTTLRYSHPEFKQQQNAVAKIDTFISEIRPEIVGNK